MPKGKYVKETPKKFRPWFLLLILIAVLAVITIVFFFYPILGNQKGDNSPLNDTNENNTITQTDDMPENAGIDPVSTDAAPTEEPSDGLTPSEEPSNGSTPTEDPSKPEKTPGSAHETQNTETQPPTVIVQKADAEYEKWLAAAMVVCVSMEYPDFELEGVYCASSKSIEDKFSSKGAYILFSSGGKKIAIHANALEQERTADGTKDISTASIGFASYDMVAPESIDLGSMEKIKLEDLSELISQSMLISIYEH